MNDKKTIPYHKTFPLDMQDRWDILDKIDDVLISGQLTNGEYVRKLEDEIQKYYHVDHVVCTSSCTQALLISLSTLDPMYYIQLAAFNWWSDLYVLKNFLSRRKVWNDIDRDTWLPIEEYGGHSLYLHTFGNIGYSKMHNVIYDASHCYGADFVDIGLATCISLAPTKLITACDGGVILTNINSFHNEIVELRDKCCRMSEVHAIIGLQTLKYLDEVKTWKKKVYEYYKDKIPGQFQKIEHDSSYNTIGFINIEELTIPKHIQYKQYYDPLHGGLKNTDFIYDNIIVLPSYYDCDYKQIVEDILEVNEKW